MTISVWKYQDKLGNSLQLYVRPHYLLQPPDQTNFSTENSILTTPPNHTTSLVIFAMYHMLSVSAHLTISDSHTLGDASQNTNYSLAN